MHVHAVTALSPETVRARFESLPKYDAGLFDLSSPLRYALNRTPPKVYLSDRSLTLSAAAEVSVTRHSLGTEIILRLMWGPLPAPFPRALVGMAVLLSLLVLVFSDRTVGDWFLVLLAMVPAIVALHQQQRGERELQQRLSGILNGTTFLPASHEPFLRFPRSLPKPLSVFNADTVENGRS